MTVYEELKAAGCKMDSHESDLYVEFTEEVAKILPKYDITYTYIGNGWIEIPFAFDPFWEKVERIKE